jgi:hypothetical protein
MDDFVDNAFTINRLGGSFFPLSLNVSRQGEVTHAFLCAQRLRDCCDLIAAFALEQLVLFGVDQVSLFDETNDTPCSLKQITAAANIPFTAVDDDTIVLAKTSLGSLLSTFNHFGLFAFDLPAAWREADVINQVIACKEQYWQTETFILPQLPASRLFIASHDDCYLTVQTRTPELIQRLFARTLSIYAETLLGKFSTQPIDVTGMPADTVETFWQDSFGLTILRKTTRIEDHNLIMGVTPKPFNFREADEYIPEFWIRYDWQGKQWAVEK